MNTKALAKSAMMVLMLGFAMASPALAQDYPSKPVRMIVPFSAGGTADAFARTFAPYISKVIGTDVIVENMAGAGGAVGASYVARQAPDGYTLLHATPGTQITNPLLLSNLAYDPVKDFTVVAPLLEAPNVLVVPSSSPAKSVQELIDLAKSKPDRLTFSSAGIGATSHLSGELFGDMAGIDVEHVPYQGSGAAMPDLVAGRVDFTIDTLATVLPLIKSGDLRALAVTTPEENPLVLGIPPLSDTLPGYSSSAVNYLLAPAGLPSEIADLWAEKSAEVLALPEFQKRLNEMGIAPLTISRSELEERIDQEREKWGEVIRSSGIVLE